MHDCPPGQAAGWPVPRIPHGPPALLNSSSQAQIPVAPMFTQPTHWGEPMLQVV
jgi:hypothetical protein